jgi:metal-sulfur cluster biosynthetic enzyme
VDDARSRVSIRFTPTIPHCSMATLIGLCIRVKLLRSLPPRFKVDVHVTPGAHASEEAVNKQLNDKERVAAALENGHLLEVVNRCIAGTDRVGDVSAALLSLGSFFAADSAGDAALGIPATTGSAAAAAAQSLGAGRRAAVSTRRAAVIDTIARVQARA